MDFRLSDDQIALRDAAGALLDGLAGSEAVRRVVEGDDLYDAELATQITEQGWTAVELSEAQAGLGMGFVEVAVLAEQVGRHVAPVPFLSSALAAGVLSDAEGDHGEIVGSLAAGELIGCVGMVGELVVDAPAADVCVMVDLDGERVTLERWDRPPPRTEAMDRTRSVARVEVGADAEHLGGTALAHKALDRVSVGLAAEMLGASERMLEVSTEYAKTREQFGRPIGSFQAVKHRLADMLVDVEGMRSAVMAAAWSVDTDAGDRSIAASTAKAWCGDASRRVMESALQVHGGIGFTWEHDLHLYLKRAHLDRTIFGDPTFHFRRVAGLLKSRVAAGQSLF